MSSIRIRYRWAALILAAGGVACAQMPRVEAGVQVGVLDRRDGFGEKPAIAGARLSARVWRFLDAEAEVDRFPVGGAQAQFPGTELLFGARAGFRSGPLGIFAKVRPGFVRFDSQPNGPSLGTRPAVDLGAAVAVYSQRHVFVRFDAGDLVVSYANGARSHFEATAGVGVWF
jgi:hypothetical protein